MIFTITELGMSLISFSELVKDLYFDMYFWGAFRFFNKIPFDLSKKKKRDLYFDKLRWVRS